MRYASAMLTVLIPTRNSEEALARTLASLVSGAVEGVVREVIVCDGGSSDGTARVADHSGCLFLPDAGLTEGRERARSEWLLVLQPGARLAAGWTEAVRDHVQAGDRPARFTASSLQVRDWLDRLTGRNPLRTGLLLKRNSLKIDGSNRLLRAVRPMRLPAQIVPAP